MANYLTSVKTNYFHVGSEELFMNFMQRVIVQGDDLELLLHTDADGNPIFGFATHGLIVGISDDDETANEVCDDDMYGNFLCGLQEIVADDDAIIILEIGSSKLEDVYATAIIITSSDTEYIDLQDVASNKAVEMLTLWK